MSDSNHVVVTGGAGFVGSNLIDRLLADGYAVTSLDNYGSGRRANLAHLTDEPAFTAREHDVRDPLPDFEEVAAVYHFASRASPADFANHPVEIAETNSIGTRNAFELARKHDARVVYASTSEVYGNPDVHPQQESYNGNVNLRGPRAPYDEAKRFGEALTIAYTKEYGLDVRTPRIFNTYGPRMRTDDGRAIPNFLSQALRGEDLTVYGDGTQTRSFCYVDDLVEAIRRLGEAPASAVSNEVFNIGNTHEITINTLAETVLDLVDTESEITHLDRPEDDPDLRKPDISRAKSVLEWEPTVDLETGLAQTIDYFETELSGVQSSGE